MSDYCRILVKKNHAKTAEEGLLLTALSHDLWITYTTATNNLPLRFLSLAHFSGSNLPWSIKFKISGILVLFQFGQIINVAFSLGT